MKVVVSTDTSVRDQIIRATNNQSLVEPQSLHATDKIQRDIEELLERHGWFYERRKNYYRNVGKPVAKFVTPMYIAAGFVALVMRNPVIAAGLKSKFMRNPVSYETVFSERDPIEVWPAIVEVLKRSEEALETMRPRGAKGERFLARSRNLLGLLGVARVLGTFNYRMDQLVTFDPVALTPDLLRQMWGVVQSVDGPQPHDPRVKGLRYYPKAQLACEKAAELFSLSGIEVVGRRRPLPRTAAAVPTSAKPDTAAPEPPRPNSLDPAFVDEIDRLLPAQPWKPGVHAQLSRELKTPKSRVAAAIAELVRTGRRLQQRDGVVFNKDGTVAAFDASRVKSIPSDATTPKQELE